LFVYLTFTLLNSDKQLIAIITMPEDNISRIQVNEQMLEVVFDRPSNRGNFGSIIRSCDALGVKG
jgi:TrmH family RNA methyltransferase